MTDQELGELLRDCPVLYHMAERDGWPSIQRHGLLSTSALLNLFEVTASDRTLVETQRRPEKIVIEHPRLGRATIRDQKPMDDASLLRCLQDGFLPADWYRLLNERVFLWLSRDRLLRLLNARPYRAEAHDVLELDAAALVKAYRDQITLSAINSGATKPFPQNRGRETFLSIAEYPYAVWRAKRKAGERAVELSVIDGIPDVARFVRRVVTMRGDQVLSTLYER